MEKELEHRTGTGSHLSLRSREEDARSHRRGRWREELEHRHWYWFTPVIGKKESQHHLPVESMKSYTPGLGSYFDSHLSLVTHLDTCYIVTLGASTLGEAKTKSAAAGSLDRIHRFTQVPGDHSHCRTLAAGNLARLSIFNFFRTADRSPPLSLAFDSPMGGGGGYSRAPSCPTFGQLAFDGPTGGGADRRLVFLLWTEFFEHPEGGGG